MKFHSTRDRDTPVSFATAFANGLAPDGGLYLPERLPQLPPDILDADGYPDLACRILGMFDSERSAADLRGMIDRACAKFDDPANAAPLRQIGEHTFVLELFHGPTLAFKDFGLQLVGELFAEQIAREGRPICVLGATSGDTGAAAIHGLADKRGAHVFILYPDGRVSPMQERQMTRTGAANVFPIPIRGAFDDAQAIVKELFLDAAFKEATALSAVNSINVARILAQAVYYVAAYRQLPAACRENARFVVPTGNFGNVFAGWLATRMGLPLRRLVVATNRNDILYRLFRTGVYAPGNVEASFAPSMDIQIASNFERFLYYKLDENPGKVTAAMRRLRAEGRLAVDGFDGFEAGRFDATRCGDDDILRLIRDTRERFGYLPDPHCACGFKDLDADVDTVVLATAHPAKFPETIHAATGENPTHPALEALRDRTPVKYPLDATPAAIRAFILDHRPEW